GFGHGKADDPHELMNVHGIINKLLLAEGTAKSALLRKESRACHYRKDYPERDDKNWIKWMITRYSGGEIRASTEDIPIKNWKYQPE
ncbi:MAG: hypothetical protein QGG48_06150, partial [Desulfatiglandales bacterium]|nr:hypothetical protein [Desulfatiglandales bacterium]